MWTNEDEERLAELSYIFSTQGNYDVVDELIQLYEHKTSILQSVVDTLQPELDERRVTRNAYRKEILDAQNERDCYKRAIALIANVIPPLHINDEVRKIVNKYLEDENAPNT